MSIILMIRATLWEGNRSTQNNWYWSKVKINAILLNFFNPEKSCKLRKRIINSTPPIFSVAEAARIFLDRVWAKQMYSPASTEDALETNKTPVVVCNVLRWLVRTVPFRTQVKLASASMLHRSLAVCPCVTITDSIETYGVPCFMKSRKKDYL